MLIAAIAAQRCFGASYANATTRIVPSISVSERYDTNVFLAPRSFVPTGRQAWDLVSTIAPVVEVINTSHQAQTNITAGVNGNVFAYNRDLSFIGTNVDASSKLDGWIGKLIPGAKLRIAETFRFTPEPPGFITGGKPSPTADAFARGIQATRANTYINIVSTDGSYALSRTVSLRGDYSYSTFKAGSIFIQPGSGLSFFNTNMHQWSVGPSLRMTRGDTLSLNYQSTTMTLSGAGTVSSFTGRGISAQYSKVTPAWTVRVSGGATLLEEGNRLFFSGKLDLIKDYDPSTKMTLTASRGIAPAFFGAPGGGALISTTAEVSVDRRVSKSLSFRAAGNYGYNETAPEKVTTFNSISLNAMLTYALTRTTSASLSYNYTYFKVSQPEQLPFLVERSLVTLSITAKWY